MWTMDYPTTVLLILAGLLTMSIMTIAGLVLSARAFTQLQELTRWLGSNLVQRTKEAQQAAITSLADSASATKSAQTDTTPTMQDNQTGNTTE